MKCNNCGFDNKDDAVFCSNCGNKLSQPQNFQEPVAQQQNAQQQVAQMNGAQQQSYQPQDSVITTNPVEGRVLKMLKEPLYLVLCILMSVRCLFAVASKLVPILAILMTIFMWLIYANARKGVVDNNNLRNISGTIFAKYVVNWVAYGFAAVIFIICTAVFASFSSTNLMNKVLSEFDSYVGKYSWLIGSITGTAITIVCVVMLIVVVIGMLINAFGLRSIHRFIQSLYMSVNSGVFNLVKVNAAKAWLMAFGVINGIGAVFSLIGTDFTGFIANGSNSAFLIIASLMIEKYFADCK